MSGPSAGRGITAYSETIAGDSSNYQRAVQFDVTDGYVGISALNGDGFPVDRVLLSPRQLTALKVFLRQARTP